jgi:hypothetical protein
MVRKEGNLQEKKKKENLNMGEKRLKKLKQSTKKVQKSQKIILSFSCDLL